MDVVELLARSFARQVSKDGAVALTSSNHPALVAAFAHLGWSDPYIDPTLLPPVVPVFVPVPPSVAPVMLTPGEVVLTPKQQQDLEASRQGRQ